MPGSGTTVKVRFWPMATRVPAPPVVEENLKGIGARNYRPFRIQDIGNITVKWQSNLGEQCQLLRRSRENVHLPRIDRSSTVPDTGTPLLRTTFVILPPRNSTGEI